MIFIFNLQGCVEIAIGGCTLGPSTESALTTTHTPNEQPTTNPGITITEVISTENAVTSTAEQSTTNDISTTTDSSTTEVNVTTTDNVSTETSMVTENEITTESISTTTGGIASTTETPTTVAPMCPPGVFVNIPNPEICHGYFMCAAGIAIPQYCPDGFEYNHTAQVSTIWLH